ncbi:MAG: hypothetical protein IKO35_07020, partial [Elusimicrobiaceae bacterium]|nr:hypothetical protein [Elusimicrobiaceae bacterium]
YTLTRFYASNAVECTGADANGAALCADFCGLDSLAVNSPCCTSNDGTTAAACPNPSQND